MTGLLRLMRSELLRMRRTALLAVHLIVPGAGAAVFLWYFSISGWDSTAKAQAYLQVVACVWPFLCGIVCGMSEEMEADIGWQNFFMLPGRRFQALLAKWWTLMLMGLGACLMAVMGFALVYRHFPGGTVYSLTVYLEAALVIWLGQAAVYLLHLVLALELGKSASIGVGIAGTLLAFLMLTGLGDGIWMVFPWAQSCRIGSYLLFYTQKENQGMELNPAIAGELGICLAVWIAVTAAAFWWFSHYEGRRSQE